MSPAVGRSCTPSADLGKGPALDESADLRRPSGCCTGQPKNLQIESRVVLRDEVVWLDLPLN